MTELEKIKLARERLDREEFDLLNKASVEAEKLRIELLEKAWLKAETLKEQRVRIAQAIQDSIDAVNPLVIKLLELSADLKTAIPETDGTEFYDSPMGPHRIMEKLTDYMAKIGWPYAKHNPMVDKQDIMSFVDFINKEGHGWAFKYRKGRPTAYDGKTQVVPLIPEKPNLKAVVENTDPTKKKPKISMSNLTSEIMP